MTVSTATSTINYTGNGVTVTFAVPFRFIENEHLRVTRTVIATGVQTELTLDSLGADGFSATGAGEATGSITVVTAPADSTQRLTIDLGNLQPTQEQAYTPNTTLPAQTVEKAIDKLTILVQNIIAGGVARVLRLIVGDTDGSGRYDANGNRIIDLADGVGAQDAATVAQVAAIGTTGTFIQSGTGAVSRTVLGKLRERVTVKDFGAVGDGATDDTDAVALALAYADSIGGCDIVFGAGRYIKNDVSGDQWVVPADTRILGEGPCSIIQFNDSSAVAGATGRVFYVDNVDNVAFEDFVVESTALTEDTSTNGKQIIGGQVVNGFRMKNVTIRNARLQAVSIDEITDVHVEGCTLDHIARGGIILRDARNVRVVGNFFRSVCDDAVGIHSEDSETDSAKFPVNHIVSDNVLEASQGIRILGARGATITGNTLDRTLRTGIHVELAWASPPRGSGGTSVEGNVPQFAIVIANNTITNTLNYQSSSSGAYAIRVWSYRLDDGGLTPDQPGVNFPIFDYTDVNPVDDGVNVSMGLFGIIVTNNVIMRTLPLVAAYSVWGFGELFDRVPTPTLLHDPAITETEFDIGGISFTGPMDGLLVSGNYISGLADGGVAIEFLKDGTDTYNTFNNTRVVNNIVRDVPGYGVHLNFTGTVDIAIERNTFDLDPFFRSSVHNADNTWSSTSGVRGVQATGSWPGLSLIGNTFKHCGQVSNATGGTYVRRENFLWSEPTVEGNNAANIGIRVVDNQFRDVNIYYDGDPTSATFGAAVNTPVGFANAMPATGFYVRDHIVWAVNGAVVPSGTSDYFILGWLRLVTGSAHVLNTDWIELRCLTGT